MTSNDFNGLIRPDKTVIFFAFDPQEQKVVFQKPLDGVTGRPKIVCVPETNTIWLAGAYGAQKFDRQTMQFSETLPWPREAAVPSSVDAREARGSRAFFAVGDSIVQLDDGAAPALKMLFTTAQGIQSLTVNDTEIYFTQRTQLWRAPLDASAR